MLQITNLRATVGDKPILKGLFLALGALLAILPTSGGAEEAVQRPVLESKSSSGSVTIPDEIASATVPYLMCLNNTFNEGVKSTGRGAGAEQVRLFEQQASSQCRATRDAAAVKADKLLLAHHKNMKPAARSSMIEDTLADIEAMFMGLGDKMDEMNAAPIEKEKTDAPNN